MRISLFLLANMLFFITLCAQDQLTFSVTPVEVDGITAADTDVPGYSSLSTSSTAPRIYKWTKEDLVISDGWQSAVCDTNGCYFPHLLEREVVMSASSGSNLDVHVYPNGNEGCAVVRVTVIDVNDPSVSAVNTYYFNPDMEECMIDATEDEQAIIRQIKLYPNPVGNYFQIDHYEEIHTVEVYNELGQQVKSFPYNIGADYDVTHLPTGTYIVRLVRKDASTIVSQSLHKL